MSLNKLYIPFILFIILGCKEDKKLNLLPNYEYDGKSLFENLSPEVTQIDFNNTINEEDYDFLNYQYVFNGGGVAIGDINNDDLPDVYFTGNHLNDKLYLNRGNFTFEDISDNANINSEAGWRTGVTMVDINQDGWLDLYVCRSGPPGYEDQKSNLLYINNQNNTFTEKAQEYGIADDSYSTQAAFFDYDLDGDLDMYLLNHPNKFKLSPEERFRMTSNPPLEMSDKLYRNDGNERFTDITIEAGILNFGHGLGISVSDFNKDGYPDIFVANDFDTPDYFYQNDGSGVFTNNIFRSFPHISLFAMGCDAGDINNDGWADIFEGEMLPADYKRSKVNMAPMNIEKFNNMVNQGLHYQYMRNGLHLNNGNNSFSDIAQMAGVQKTEWTWGTLLQDFDHDGWKDLVVTNGYLRDPMDRDFGEKVRQKASDNNEISRSELLKLLPSTPIKNVAFSNNGDLTFDKKSDDWGFNYPGFSTGMAYGDLDNDGDEDLVVNNINAPALVYKNTVENTGKNYLKIKLSGPDKNLNGLNTKVTLSTPGGIQFQEMQVTRGYQSSMEPILLFGLDQENLVTEIHVDWLDGKQSVLKDIPTNQTIEIHYSEAEPTSGNDIEITSLLEFANDEIQPLFRHQEKPFDDFKREILLPHKLSQLGPFISIGDVNGDGREDFHIGGATGFFGAIFIQTRMGSFEYNPQPALSDDRQYEDMGSAFVDIDGDNDLDLYVSSGSNEFPEGSNLYKDRIYINDGKGNFTRSEQAIPTLSMSSSCVIPNDYDRDGDMDLFIGGRLQPGNYPHPPSSVLLQNNNGQYSPLDRTNAPGIEELGMVTDAEWIDIDGDNDDDLVIVGEWMPVTVLENDKGSFSNKTESYGLENTVGWWYSIESADLNGDGKEELILGNIGLNYKIKPSAEKPFHVFADDFDGNQKNDIYLAYHTEDRLVPVRGRECSSQQMPEIADRFKTYSEFADAEVYDIIRLDEENTLEYQATNFASGILSFEGSKAKFKALPNIAQISSINGIVVEDFNQDGHQDILVAGNLYQTEVETSRMDAGVGCLLLGNGDLSFKPLSIRESGFFAKLDVKDLKKIKLSNNGLGILIGQNNSNIKYYKMSK